MNAEPLLKIKEHILAEPRRINMDYIVLNREYGHWWYGNFPECGTVACIAGWGRILFDPNWRSNLPELLGSMDFTQRLLGIDKDSGNRLFLDADWPLEFQDKLDRAKRAVECAEVVEMLDAALAEYAAVVGARIDHFIATDGRE